MGGCLDQPKSKKKQIAPPPAAQTLRLSASRYDLTAQLGNKESEVHLKYKKMSVNELLITYRVQSTLQTSCKLQGPKYLSHLVDGSSKIMRIVTLSDIDEKRLGIYKSLIGFDVYQNDEGTLMILDEFCSGEDFYQIMAKFKQSPAENVQRQLLKALRDACAIIQQFHKNKIWLGNLNLSSFKKVSCYDQTLRLVDFNFNKSVTDYQKMGLAHKQSFQADYEFVGYLIQFLVCQQPPIFIPHKLSYVQFQNIPHFHLIERLLKGKKWNQSQLSAIKHTQIINKQRASLGYRFRRDVNKLLKMRKKRRGHNRKFYGQDAKTLINQFKFPEELVYRYQSERLFTKIEFYLSSLSSYHQEAFLNYSGSNESLRRLKEVFMLTDGAKKIAQLKQCLSTIK